MDDPAVESAGKKYIVLQGWANKKASVEFSLGGFLQFEKLAIAAQKGSPVFIFSTAVF